MSGAAKMAAATWAAAFVFSDAQAPVSDAARRGSAVVLSATTNASWEGSSTGSAAAGRGGTRSR